MRRAFLLFILVALPCPAVDELGRKVDSLFAAWDKSGSPGAAVAVARSGEIVYERGYGLANLEYDIPNGPATVFHVASVSKQFTAMAILLLERQGKLAINDDVHKYLPELPSYGARITLHQLMNHTSGLRDQWDLLVMAGWRMDDVITQRQILDMVFHQKKLNFPPGTEHLYSNTGFTLLAEIVRRVSGKPLTDFAREQIFQPLGMTRTHFHDDHEMVVKNRAYSYQPDRDTFKLAALNYANVGATSLFTTAEDLVKWAHNFEEPKVGDRALIERMETPGILENGEKFNYGCGLMVGDYRGLRIVGHSGADAGYRSNIAMFPDEKFTVVVLANLGTIQPGRLANQIADIYLADRFTRPALQRHPPAPVRREHQRLTLDQLREFAGTYTSEELGTSYRLVLREGQLVATHRRRAESVLTHRTGDDFDSNPRLGEVHFERGADGKISAMLLSTQRVRKVRLVRVEEFRN
jgi:CubicO group peptidase (beta-lactamase class C family)